MFSSNTSSAAGDAVFVEDVFSTTLYSGTGSPKTITNGIDLAGKGGMVWAKDRGGAFNHELFDTVRGTNSGLISNLTVAGQSYGPYVYNSDGFSYGTGYVGNANINAGTYVSWTFREQPKFFDVVTYTGDGQTFRTVNHNLGAMPGFIICKCTSTTSDWSVLAKMSSGSSDFIPLNLNSTASSRYGGGLTTAVSSTLFYTADLGFDGASNDQLRYNQNGATYVAYLFAHNAGGFGLSGTDNVISCGSFTTDGSAAATVNLGYEPQWVLFKRTDSATNGDWVMFDNMRGLPATGSGSTAARLIANTSAAENPTTGDIKITSTGFVIDYVPSASFIYIAIRRGPMKVPTTGTSVFTPVSTSGNVTSITSGFPVDFALGKEIKNSTSYGNYAIDRLRGGAVLLETNTTGVEYTSQTFKFDSNTQFLQSGGGLFYGPSIYWLMRRAPSFFDVVNWYITGSADLRVNHNLTVTPELIITKTRSQALDWYIYHKDIGVNGYAVLNTNAAASSASGAWGTPTATEIGVNTSGFGFTSFNFAISYLFASAPGVSKVGSYTGNGSSQTINCGFTGGARFVMIKRTDNTGDWYVWDTARGIVSGNDPHLSLNTTAAEVTTDDTIDTDSTGFVVNQVSATNVNVSSGTFVFLAIA
jgi:hypothetical protein